MTRKPRASASCESVMICICISIYIPVGSPRTSNFLPCMCNTIVHKYLFMSVCVYINIKTVVFMWCAFVCVCIYVGMTYHGYFLLHSLYLFLMYIYICICLYMHMYICMCVCVCIYIYIYCVCVCVCVRVCVCVCNMCVHADTDSPRLRRRESEPRPPSSTQATQKSMRGSPTWWNASVVSECVDRYTVCVRACVTVISFSFCLCMSHVCAWMCTVPVYLDRCCV